MRKIKIFLVDDEAIAIRHFQRIIGEDSETYEIAGTAENGEQALKQIELVQPDVVFADVQMPVMNGLELTEKIRMKYPTVRVILLTAYKDFEYAQRGINAGVVAYLVKHEMTRKQIVGIIEKISREIQEEEEKRKAYLEKNMQAFLSGSDGTQGMQLGYGDYHFLLLDIVVRMPICLGRAYGGNTDLPVNILENQLRSEDIFCKIALKMTEATYSILLFLKKGLNEKSYYFQLHSVLNIAQKFFTDNGVKIIMMVSGIVERFGDLPGVYRKQRQHEPYVYAGKSKRIMDFGDAGSAEHDYAGFLKLRDKLYADNRPDKKIACMKEVFSEGRKACTISQYLSELNNMAVKIILQGEKMCIPEAAEWEVRRRQPFADLDEAETWLLDIYGFFLTEKEERNKPEYSEIIRRAVSFMKREYAQPLTSTDICIHLGISESHFRRVFKQEVGMKPMEYLNIYRIEVSKRLLRDNTCRIQEVYERVGFASSQYFSTVFKKITGISPGQYQQNKGLQYNEKDD